MKCCLCKKEIPVFGDWAEGNSAEPIKSGRCCDKCNREKVIPERLRRMVLQDIAHKGIVV